MKSKPFAEAALEMLEYAGIKPKAQDVLLLANDLRGVAEEFEDIYTDDQEAANHAVHILRSRIGGYQNLESYMRCLHAGARRL